MKIKINRNILWSETFVKELEIVGVKNVCISPGSRNTPLTLAFAKSKKIKTYLHIDERSSAFFALGLAKATNNPVALVCTSGTATAEFYPAIVEAYQQRVPLIVCTADRPPELRELGANQTINQNDLYHNHIRFFIDMGLPSPTKKRITKLKEQTHKAFNICSSESRGPVHLNFPFKKPFEPDQYTDEVNRELLIFCKQKLTDKKKSIVKNKNRNSEKLINKIFSKLKTSEKGIIIVGPGNYDKIFLDRCVKLSKYLGYPILADGASQIRFGNKHNGNLIANFDGVLRSSHFSNSHQPDIILQFGRTITSKALEIYLGHCKALRYMINEFGDWFDPSNKAEAAIAYKPYQFCELILKKLSDENIYRKSNGWLNSFLEADKISSLVKKEVVEIAKFPNETRVINELLEIIPDGSQIMLSNSMPIRDFDYFASKTHKKIIVYNNRGASGIDGITSTALGALAANNKPTILLTGDLAFYYDMNGLLAAKKYSLPLIIVLINNNGGGIFEVLPISNYGKVFNDFFIASHNLNFANFVKGYEGNYKQIKSWQAFRSAFSDALKSNNFSVLEIKTNAAESLKTRKEFWAKVSKKLNK